MTDRLSQLVLLVLFSPPVCPVKIDLSLQPLCMSLVFNFFISQPARKKPSVPLQPKCKSCSTKAELHLLLFSWRKCDSCRFMDISLNWRLSKPAKSQTCTVCGRYWALLLPRQGSLLLNMTSPHQLRFSCFQTTRGYLICYHSCHNWLVKKLFSFSFKI